jgi:hypothetical protein
MKNIIFSPDNVPPEITAPAQLNVTINTTTFVAFSINKDKANVTFVSLSKNSPSTGFVNMTNSSYLAGK